MLPDNVQNHYYDKLTNKWVKGVSDTDGNQEIVIVPGASPNKIQSSRDDNFIASNDPALFDLNSLLGKNGTEFVVTNEGGGDIDVSYSSDGSIFNTPFRVSCNRKFGDLSGDIHTVKIEHTGIDSAYSVIGK